MDTHVYDTCKETKRKLSPDSSSLNSNQIGIDTCDPFIFSNKLQLLETERNARDDFVNSLHINEDYTPEYPMYSVFEERLKSFVGWPRKSKNLSPDVLSAAGFFYTRCEDYTRCFHCGGGLKTWEESDEPWIEHAHWFPKCYYVLSVKGQQFVDDVRFKRHENLDRTQKELKSAINALIEIIPKNTSISKDIVITSRKEMKNSPEESVSPSFDKSRMMCVICLTEERNTILLPCYHLVACNNCAVNLTKCCICREPIIFRRSVYIP